MWSSSLLFTSFLEVLKLTTERRQTGEFLAADLSPTGNKNK